MSVGRYRLVSSAKRFGAWGTPGGLAGVRAGGPCTTASSRPRFRTTARAPPKRSGVARRFFFRNRRRRRHDLTVGDDVGLVFGDLLDRLAFLEFQRLGYRGGEVDVVLVGSFLREMS